MRVGLALPQFDYSLPGSRPATWEALAGWARSAEALGFESVWLADHLFLSIEKYGAPPGNHEGFDPLVALGALARVTSTVRLGTLVLCSQLRPASVVAKMAATVDVLSHGRLELGVGAGWFEPEYHAAGIEFLGPGARLAELAGTLDTLDRFLRGAAAPLRPQPHQRPRPPLFAGGRGDRLLDVVAQHADGWNTVWRLDPDGYRERLKVLDAACERAGRDPATVVRTIGLYALVGEDERDLRARYDRLVTLAPPGVLEGVSLDEWRSGHLVGTVDDVAEQLERWAELGVSRVIACPSAVPFGVTAVDDLEPLASAAARSLS